MGQKTDSTAVEKGNGNGGGTSSNGQPNAQNRDAPKQDVDGISKKKLRKTELERLIAGETAELEKGKGKSKEEREKMKKAFELLEAWEKELGEVSQEIEKAVGDRSVGSPATGLDTVSSNGNEKTETHKQAPAADSAGGNGVAKNADPKAPVKKDDIGVESKPEASSANQTAQVDETTGGLTKMFEEFKKQMEVSLEGTVTSVKNLLKEHQDSVEKKIQGVEKSAQDAKAHVEKATKIGGLSNSVVVDFDNESERSRDKVNKDDGDEWTKHTDTFGSLKQTGK